MLDKDAAYMLDKYNSPSTNARYQIGSEIHNRVRTSRFTVSYADLVDGEAVLFKDDVSGEAIPANALIRRALIYVKTAFAGDGDGASTIALGLEDQDNDLLAAATLAAGFTAGHKDGIPVDTAATRLRTTAARQLAVTLAINATDTEVTAGEMEVFVDWVLGQE